MRVLALAAAIPAWAGTIEGIAKLVTTGAPVAGAAISVRGKVRVHTGPDGRFRIAGLGSGGSLISAHAEGLSPSERNVSWIIIGGESDVKTVSIGFVPYGSIRGRVLDEDGKPVIGINVDAARPSGSGKVTSTTTGADGGYAFKELPPAEYLLNTRPGRFTTGEGFLHWAPTTVPPPPVKGQARAWRTEYYPGGSDLSQAEKIVLRPGASLQGYDLRLRAVPAHPYEGRVVDEKGDPVAATVLWYEGRLGVAEHLTEAGPDGRFRVPAVREGEWKVVALRAKGASPAAAFLQVAVSGSQSKPVELRVEPPFTLEGSVKVPATVGPEVRKQIGLFLRAVNTVSYKTVLSSMDASGRLELPGVYRGRYEVRTGYVEGAYPVSVRQGGREVLGQTVDLYPGAPPFEAEYRTATARIEGVVEKCPGCRVHVIPTDPMHLLIRGPRLTWCDADGRFRIGAVAEGSYRVLAFDVAPGGMTPHFDDRFQGGSAVSLKDGESATLELRVSPWPLPLF